MKPILFNTEMVRAILEGRKTVTRRVVKNAVGSPEDYGRNHYSGLRHELNGDTVHLWAGFYKDSDIFYIDGEKHIDAICFKSLYQPGDILYVREAWQQNYDGSYAYRAGHKFENKKGWRPSIHMPREAARIFLRVKNVRVERLQDSFSAPISPIFALREEGMNIGDDCWECIENYGEPCCVETVDEDGSNMYGGECGLLDSIRGEFSELWDNTVKPADRDRYGWAANPWVFVISFERISREEARGDA